jgi:hypothetical protein
MNKLEYFSKVIKVVTELMDVTEEEILNARFFAAVDARWIVIRLMHDKGYKTRQIAPLVNSAKRSVNHALAFFDDKANFSENDVRGNYEKAKRILAKAEQ